MLLLLAAPGAAAPPARHGPERACADALPKHLVLEIDPERLADWTEGGREKRLRIAVSADGVRTRGRLATWPAGAPDDASALTVSLPGSRPRFGLRRFHLRPASPGSDGARRDLFARLCSAGIVRARSRVARVSVGPRGPEPMLLIEHPAKEMLEHQQRRDGVIFRFAPRRGAAGKSAPPGTDVVALDAAATIRSEARSRQLDVARALLNGFLQEKLGAEDVFDLDVLARFLAIADERGADALLAEPNLRFYFNPVTQHIEPVAFDGERPIGTRHGAPSRWRALLLEDPTVRQAYEAAGADVRRARDMESASPARVLGPLAAQHRRGADGDRLELRSRSDTPIRIQEVSRIRDAERTPVPAPKAGFGTVPPRGRVTVPLGGPARLVQGSLFEVSAVVSGEARRLRLAAVPPAPALSEPPLPHATLEEALEQHPFLRADPDGRVLRAGPGTIRVARPLVLPPGAGLTLAAGTTLRFPARGILVASGPLRFEGTAERPVVLEGQAGPLGPGRWQGIVSLHTDEPHEWRSVRVRRTDGIEADGWALTGGVTLRRAAVRMTDVRFEDNRAEDALNLIRARFDLRRVSVLRTRSDGLDADFSSGEIEGGRFRDVGGDAIDVSGSRVRVHGTILDRVHDKALSVGEGSVLHARGVRIRDSGTALASKDASHARIEASDLSEIHHPALMSYVKKPAFGPASVEAEALTRSAVAELAAAQHGSRIVIDGVPVETTALDPDALYRTGFMRK